MCGHVSISWYMRCVPLHSNICEARGSKLTASLLPILHALPSYLEPGTSSLRLPLLVHLGLHLFQEQYRHINKGI